MGNQEILFIDSYLEVLHLFNRKGEFLTQIDRATITAALDRAGVWVEQSGGPGCVARLPHGVLYAMRQRVR